MTRDEVLAALGEARGALNERLHAIPEGRLESAPAGHAHSPRAIVAHIAAYDDLVVRRLRAARAGEGTEFVRDRESWERFNEQGWATSGSLPAAGRVKAFSLLHMASRQLTAAPAAARVRVPPCGASRRWARAWQSRAASENSAASTVMRWVT